MTPLTGKMGRMSVPDIHEQRLEALRKRAALSLHFFWYNFGRIHRTLSCTPAMEAGLAGSVWSVDQLLPM